MGAGSTNLKEIIMANIGTFTKTGNEYKGEIVTMSVPVSYTHLDVYKREDLRLVAVAYDPAGGRNSVAVVHDVSGKEKVQYRLRIGQGVGRMRVASISPKSVAFTIEEFGYSRQETLALGDSNKERKQ